MDAKELIDEIEKPAKKTEEQVTGECDHILGARCELDMERESQWKVVMELCADHLEKGYTREDAYEVVFNYCPTCGEKLK